jgi:hypothetical protein
MPGGGGRARRLCPATVPTGRGGRGRTVSPGRGGAGGQPDDRDPLGRRVVPDASEQARVVNGGVVEERHKPPRHVRSTYTPVRHRATTRCVRTGRWGPGTDADAGHNTDSAVANSTLASRLPVACWRPAESSPMLVGSTSGASMMRFAPSSSRGPGRRPFKAVARVRIPLGARTTRFHLGPLTESDASQRPRSSAG